jgi:RNA polymerase sigma-70 factor, ECF subfamily
VDASQGPDDLTLAKLARDGSSAAFGVLVHRYHARVFAFLHTLTRHRQDAEDLTQETFMRAWDKFHRYDLSLPLLPWLFTLARRQSISALRRLKPLPPELPDSATAEPTHAALRLWELARRDLPPETYSALWLHYCEELPLKEVAGILGKREGAVKVMLHRARKTLAERFRGGGCPPPPLLQAQPPPLPEPQGTLP